MPPAAFTARGTKSAFSARRQARSNCVLVRRDTITYSTNTSNTKEAKLDSAVRAAAGTAGDSNIHSRGGKCARVFQQTSECMPVHGNACQYYKSSARVYVPEFFIAAISTLT